MKQLNNRLQCVSRSAASDYCVCCGKDTTYPSGICPGRLREIDDSEVLAFGCNYEALCDDATIKAGVKGEKTEPCAKWCKHEGCPVTLRSAAEDAPPTSEKSQVIPLGQKRHDLQSLVDDIKRVVYSRDGAISVTEAIGALEIAKIEIFSEQR